MGDANCELTGLGGLAGYCYGIFWCHENGRGGGGKRVVDTKIQTSGWDDGFSGRSTEDFNGPAHSQVAFDSNDAGERGDRGFQIVDGQKTNR